MKKVSFISGVGFIALSGILYTIERFIAVFLYASEIFPVKLNGNGSHPGEPYMPTILDNFFVGLLLVLGLALLIFGISQVNGRKRNN